MKDRLALLDRAKTGWLEHIEWRGAPFNVPRDRNYVVAPGLRGSIVQVGKNFPGVFGLADDKLADDQILVLFEGAILVPLSIDGEWRPLDEPQLQVMQTKVSSALARFLHSDGNLLRTDTNERTLTARLALHLQPEFADWHVDCEYNRVTKPVSGKVEAKKLAMWLAYVEGFAMNNGFEMTQIFPDIIVHMRESCCNLLVIEVKKHKEGDREFSKKKERDIHKLTAIRAQLGYRYAAFISVDAGAEGQLPEVMWLEQSDQKPGGPLCYLQYMEGDALYFSSGGGASRLSVSEG